MLVCAAASCARDTTRFLFARLAIASASSILSPGRSSAGAWARASAGTRASAATTAPSVSARLTAGPPARAAHYAVR